MPVNQVDRRRKDIERLVVAWVSVYGRDAEWHAEQKSVELREWGDW